MNIVKTMDKTQTYKLSGETMLKRENKHGPSWPTPISASGETVDVHKLREVFRKSHVGNLFVLKKISIKKS